MHEVKQQPVLFFSSHITTADEISIGQRKGQMAPKETTKMDTIPWLRLISNH
jgi:hypothetical protein